MSVSEATEALVSASLDEFGALLMGILTEGGVASETLLLRGVIGGGLHIARAWIATGYAESGDAVADAALRLYALMAPPAPQLDRPARPGGHPRRGHLDRLVAVGVRQGDAVGGVQEDAAVAEPGDDVGRVTPGGWRVFLRMALGIRVTSRSLPAGPWLKTSR